jgi:hypothetical protein
VGAFLYLALAGASFDNLEFPMTTPPEGAVQKPARMTATQLKEKAQAMSGLALDTLASIMRGDGQDAVKLAAAREMLDRAHGKPTPPAKPKSKAQPKAAEAMTVIVKRFTDVTPEDEAEADATEARL